MRPLAALALAAALAAPAAGAAERFETSAGPVVVESRGPELSHPWAFAFLPDFPETGALLVTERQGRLLLVQGDDAEEITNLPPVAAVGQGGLLDVALAPDFAESGTLFLSHAAPASGGATNTVVTRARLNRDALRLEDATRVFEMTSDRSAGRHFGSRLVFAEDGTLWITTGDRGDRPSAQDPFSHNGKVHRVTQSGEVPPDNPFADGEAALPTVWSLGHRNAQGAARHPETGELWTVAHGARGGDEVNVARPGRNYGWPEVSYGTHYSGRDFPAETSPDTVEPIHWWDPSIAPSGAAFYDADLFPDWRGDLLVGALKFEMLVRLDVEDGDVVGEERLFEDDFGRVRAVEVAPDGAIWFALDEAPTRLRRAIPAP
ncbi:MAG: PQQ-dependent sugar dehydrogenase [Paracoccaceae bacterium]